MSNVVPRCPVCASARIVSIVGPQGRAFCTRCGARWDRGGVVVAAVRSRDAILRLINGSGDRPRAS